MAAIYHPGVVLTIPKYDLGQPTNAANVIAWQTAAVGLTVAQLQAVQTAFDTAWSGAWKNWTSSSNRYMGCWVVDMASATGNQVTNALYTPVAGVGASTSWPDMTSGLISLHTATRYRGGHGRLYIPGGTAASVNADGRTLTSTAITQIGAMWANTVSALGALAGTAGGPYNPIVWHKKLASSPNSVESITGVVVQSVIATQRRRVRKVTRHHRH